MKTLKIDDLYYDYKTKAGTTHALRGVNAEFNTGTMYALTGRSGSGKTTLLSLIAAFDSPLSGSIMYNGVCVSESDSSAFRRENIGIIFQSYNLVLHISALENVILSLDISGKKRGSRKETAKRLLSDVGLDESHMKKLPMNLSGGEQQRVAVARALASDPPVILADEPTGNLDNENSKVIIGLLRRLAHENGKCVIVVTHSEEIAAEADVRYHMSDGKLQQYN